MKLKYASILGWMYEIGCESLREVVAYAVIYGFSQDNSSTFNGSLSYIQQFLLCSKNTAIDTLKGLEEKGLIKKEQYEISGVKFNRYSVIEQVVQKLNHPCSEIEPNINNIYNTPDNISKDNYSPQKEATLFGDVIIPVVATPKVDLKFERFWKVYDKKVQKVQAEKMWKKLTEKEKDEILSRVALYVLSTPDAQYRMNPATYINPSNKRWLDELRQPASQPNRPQGNYIIKDGVAHPVV